MRWGKDGTSSKEKVRAARIDRTQNRVVKAFRQAGCEVLLLHRVGQGCPDAAITKHRNKIIFVEIKDIGKRDELTGQQIKFHALWPVYIVTTPEEAIELVNKVL